MAGAEREAGPGLLSRLGAALVAPRSAHAAAEAHPGRTASDAALLLLFYFACTEVAAVVGAGWLGGQGELAAAAGQLVSRVAAAVTAPLVFLFAGGVLAAIVRRSLGLGFDLACVALVPLVAAHVVAAAIALAAGGTAAGDILVDLAIAAGYGWAAVVLGLALWQALSRRDPPDSAGARRGFVRAAGVGLVGAMALLLVAGLVRVATDLDRVRPVSAGAKAPEFSLPLIGEGGALGPETVELSSLRGKVLVVDFWATWCAPCRDAMPVLERLRGEYSERGVEVVSINTEGPEMAAEALAMARRLSPSAVLLSDDGRVADLYQVTTIPHLVVIDRRGYVRLVHRGFKGAAGLERDLVEALSDLVR